MFTIVVLCSVSRPDTISKLKVMFSPLLYIWVLFLHIILAQLFF